MRAGMLLYVGFVLSMYCEMILCGVDAVHCIMECVQLRCWRCTGSACALGSLAATTASRGLRGLYLFDIRYLICSAGWFPFPQYTFGSWGNWWYVVLCFLMSRVGVRAVAWEMLWAVLDMFTHHLYGTDTAMHDWLASDGFGKLFVSFSMSFWIKDSLAHFYGGRAAGWLR